MIYCFESSRGVVIEQDFAVGQAPRAISVGGVQYFRSYSAEHKSAPPQKGWPIECYASGVHPDQAHELRRYFREAGVPTDVTSNGNPVYRDHLHRRKALKCRNIVDRASYI
jgi:hypothetical protein